MHDLHTFLLASLTLLGTRNLLLASPVATSTPTVTIDSGVIVGVQSSLPGSSNQVNQYLAVPFAASPTRFSPPQTPTPWLSPYQATQRGPACIQQFDYPEAARNFSIAAFNTPAPDESEDCLTVNVFVPAGSEGGNELKAVMFWIYGGALQFGWNGVAIYDGSSFAVNQDVIVVATNYRTNVFGFPGAPSLPIAERNLGYLDQRFALSWVQRNIRSFGGDPDRVTIFGESAGGFSVDALITSFTPANPPPFYAAIMQSGQSSVSPQAASSGSAWASLISQLNCTTDDLTCARAAPASTLKNIEETVGLSFQPTADNVTFLRYPNRARAAGQIYSVPILTGSNANEGTLFTFTDANTTELLQTTIPGITAEQIDTIKQVYPIGERAVNSGNLISNDTSQIAYIYTDLVFECPCAIVSNTSINAGIPTWRYFYNSTFDNVQLIPGYDFGVFHSSEIPLVFGTYGFYTENEGPTAQEMRLSEYMQTSWATFAKNPAGGPAGAGWPEAPYIHVLGGEDGVDEMTGGLTGETDASSLDGERCQLWEPIYELTTGV